MRLLLHHGLRFDEPLVSKAYKAFIASKRCMVCPSVEVQVHHSVYKSTGNLCSDIFCVPLCVSDHALYHKLGRAGFESKFGLDMDERVWSYISEYCHKNGIDLRAELVVYLESIIKGIGK